MKKFVLFLLVFLFGLACINSNAYGFGLASKGNQRPNAGKYEKIINENGGIYLAPDQKEIYLTFDCGYENGYTGQILDTLLETNTKAIFFITGHYLNSATDLVRRMVNEGHIVGNHTYAHRDFTKSTDEEIMEDITKLEQVYQEKMGSQLSCYVRPPRGEFDERSLKLLNTKGYKTIFWSLAYVDWNKDSYYGNHYSYKQVMKRIHNGAIILMHTVSKDNAMDLKDIICDLKKEGYVFNPLNSVI